MRGKWKIETTSFIWAVVLALCVWPDNWPLAAQARGDAKEGERIAAELQKTYDAVVDFSADFQQDTEIKTLNRKLNARGKVYFKRPGKMLWRYDEPRGQWLLADGKSLYLYQPEQTQILKSPLQSAFRSDVPLSFLLGLGNINRDFKATLTSRDEGHYILQLGPKGEAGPLGEVELGVDRQAFDVRWARIRDAVGNITTVRLANMKKGLGLKDSFFRPQIPDGTDVVELGR